jgi:hypothetical protein
LGSLTWEELLLSKRVLIVSEAGAGKTYECRRSQQVLWQAGEPAFFLELATLSGSSVREMLTLEEEQRFDQWLRSQSEIATFFLDSVDEIKVTHGSFDQALKRLAKAISGQLSRVRVVTTTRPVPIDRQLIEKHLPIPAPLDPDPTAEAFADLMTDKRRQTNSREQAPKEWRNVGLMPLSDAQIRELAIAQGISDPDDLLEDIYRRDAIEFVQRPQDLIEECADWLENRRVGTHQQQVMASVVAKLKPNSERHELAPLSLETATEGACRLALAATLTRKLTFRYGAASDSVEASEMPLDASKILTDWSIEEQQTLLQRPLFGFASYGRVRFQHRSTIEFLGAKRLETLLDLCVSIKSIKRLLFTRTAQGDTVVRPSMRPLAAWLALWRGTIFSDLVRIDPAASLELGDPQSLSPAQRAQALESYVAAFGAGSWRGLSTPRVQVRRFASPELASTVTELWSKGIENPEVRDLLLELIETGRLRDCADIAYGTAISRTAEGSERRTALRALVQLNDSRLAALADSVANNSELWPDSVARRALLDMFPNHLSISQFTQILRRLEVGKRTVDEIDYYLPRKIETAHFSSAYVDQVAQTLTDLIIETLICDENHHPQFRTSRTDLVPALVAACLRQGREGHKTLAWTKSSLLAVRLSGEDYISKDIAKELRILLSELSSTERETAFWAEDALMRKYCKTKEAWQSLYDLSENGGIQLNFEKDASWVRSYLSDTAKPVPQREMMLWAELNLLRRGKNDEALFYSDLRTAVSDSASLTAVIDQYLAPPSYPPGYRDWEKESEKRKRDQRQKDDKNHKSWINFWSEIASNPSAAFAAGRVEDTAWNLWRAMAKSGDESRESGWNRRLIEANFGKAIADNLRQAMIEAWRKVRPTLRSERPDNEKNTYYTNWEFGLAAIAAEAEDPTWATRLTEPDAELACRYVPIQFNGFPFWLEDLVSAHPMVVDRVLGGELSKSLCEDEGNRSHSSVLQDITHTTSRLAMFFAPRVKEWLEETLAHHHNKPVSDQNLVMAVEVLLNHGTNGDRKYLEDLAKSRLQNGISIPHGEVWLLLLFKLKPSLGVEAFENWLSDLVAHDSRGGDKWFAALFGRDHGRIKTDLSDSGFTPDLLLRLVRLAYEHVRVENDQHHEGSFSPNTRDDAQTGRNALLGALLSTKGVAGWKAKLELANDPLLAHFKDRAIALAQAKAAEEADSSSLSEAEFVVLDRQGEAQPNTTEAMFQLMKDRLDDIDDLLLQDVSPREAWASIKDERVMRKELARTLRNAANSVYTVDQEASTADEKETDIRLRSTSSLQQGVIELKLGEKKRTATELRATLKDQLLVKYMASDDCRAGCLIISIASDKRWKHPDTNAILDFDGLIALLNEEAERLSAELGGAAKLMAKGMDLRPRLSTEKRAKKTHTVTDA